MTAPTLAATRAFIGRAILTIHTADDLPYPQDTCFEDDLGYVSLWFDNDDDLHAWVAYLGAEAASVRSGRMCADGKRWGWQIHLWSHQKIAPLPIRVPGAALVDVPPLTVPFGAAANHAEAARLDDEAAAAAVLAAAASLPVTVLTVTGGPA